MSAGDLLLDIDVCRGAGIGVFEVQLHIIIKILSGLGLRCRLITLTRPEHITKKVLKYGTKSFIAVDGKVKPAWASWPGPEPFRPLESGLKCRMSIGIILLLFRWVA